MPPSPSNHQSQRAGWRGPNFHDLAACLGWGPPRQARLHRTGSLLRRTARLRSWAATERKGHGPQHALTGAGFAAGRPTSPEVGQKRPNSISHVFDPLPPPAPWDALSSFTKATEGQQILTPLSSLFSPWQALQTLEAGRHWKHHSILHHKTPQISLHRNRRHIE